ncbi:MAG: PIN domain-containing protein [Deltaproteobacteria bacterium]|nr:PIN domain-containing protein [Deltaproteobacteria bacterium]
MKRYLLDTSALLTLKHEELGADEVEHILRQASYGKVEVWVSFITFMELFYIVWQKQGQEEAYRIFLEIKALPIKKMDTNESLGLIAGELKAKYSISVADSWIAASSVQVQAVLVHKDPEFESLKDILELQALPYKKTKTS